MKRILGVSKTSRTTSLMYAVGLEPCELKLDKMKLELLARIAVNETTNSILQNSINDFNKNKDPKSVRYRLLGEVIDETITQ
jgi:hypothetical protein